MTEPRNYLAFARAHFGQARFDFALSGEHAPRSLVEPGGRAKPGAVEALREALAEFLGRPSAEVVPCIGTSQAMALAAACLRGPGRTVALEAPIYEPLRLAFEGAETVAVVREPARGYALDAPALAAIEGAAALVVAEPHNPTGARTGFEALRARLASYPGDVLVDEVYAPFDGYVDGQGRWPGRGRELHPRAWAIGSLTKAYGLGPYRVGWLAVPASERARVDEAVVRAVGELPLRWATDAIDVLAQVPAIAAEHRATIADRRRLVVDALREIPGLEVHAPAAGPFGWVRVPEGLDVLARVKAWARDDGLVVSPGVYFGDPRGIRIAWTSPLDRLREGVPVLARRLREFVNGAGI